MKICLTTCVLLFCLSSNGIETNSVYVIDDGMLVLHNTKGEFKLDKLKVEAAKKMKECLPAPEFPEGNWGPITGGFQLSLRFETNMFAVGSPIVATIILRNATNCVLNYHVMGVLGRTSPISVMITDTGGASVPLRSNDIVIVSTRDVKLYPGTEQKFSEQIDNLYNLPTNGIINACAELNIGRPNNIIEIRSAKVPIIIH